MRVALVCGYDWEAPGGVQGQVAALASELARGGDTVAVVTPSGRLPQARASDGPLGPAVEGVRIVRVGRGVGLPANGSVAPIAPTPVAIRATLRALREIRPDVLHIHEPLVPGPPLVAALFGSRPIVATFHRAESDRLYRAAGRLLGPRVSGRIDAAVGVSGEAIATAREILGPGLGEMVEVTNGVDVRRFARARAARSAAPGAPGGASGSPTFKSDGGPVVMFVGRHEERKGLGTLLAAHRLMRSGARLDIVGTGPETLRLREGSSPGDAVRWLGQIDDEALADVIAAADLLVAPSLGGESFGVILLEGMAAGTAVVASDIPGYRLAAGDAARFVTPGDADALARAIDDLLADGPARDALVASGLARAEECSIVSVAAQYREIYRRALSGGSGGLAGSVGSVDSADSADSPDSAGEARDHS